MSNSVEENLSKGSIWQKSKIIIASIVAITFPYLFSRTALAVRVLENKDFSERFKGGAFAGQYTAHHDKYKSLDVGLLGFLKNRYILERDVANEIKNSDISRWEALKCLSPSQKAVGLLSFSVGVVALGAVLWSLKKQQEPEITENQTQHQDILPLDNSHCDRVIEYRAKDSTVKQR